MSLTDEKVAWYLTKFRTFEESLNGESASELHATRRAAIRRFAELGFPTTKNEEWRFTDVTPIAGGRFEPVLGAAPAPKGEARDLFLRGGGLTGPRLVFLDGRFAPELSRFSNLPGGVTALSLKEALSARNEGAQRALAHYAPFDMDAFTALNTGFLSDGVFLQVADGTQVNDPLYVVFIATGVPEMALTHPRTLILTGRGSSISVIEQYASLSPAGRYFTNEVTEIVGGEGSRVEHTKLQLESTNAFHIGSTYIHLDRGARFTSTLVSVGGALVRNNVTALLASEGIECTLNGISLANGQQHVDNHTTIDHAMPRSSSHELYKTILDGKSKGVFNGKIYVRPDAQKTDAKQTNKTLLLSDDATMNTKPQLEIFADDVRCTHGATIGSLDEEARFYLRSRGISDDLARDMLTYAFAADVTSRVTDGSLREHLSRILREKLEQGRMVGEGAHEHQR